MIVDVITRFLSESYFTLRGDEDWSSFNLDFDDSMQATDHAKCAPGSTAGHPLSIQRI